MIDFPGHRNVFHHFLEDADTARNLLSNLASGAREPGCSFLGIAALVESLWSGIYADHVKGRFGTGLVAD
ncbi:hypothetical protein LshimejAT787_0600380 [Lyophyllum shimeji]|uniref:Uncharacterized protein n=1 Tax=Lyophyllum shimeji TaxID=47721 RepID=A0A9P3UQ47_LYOSH|nr:hypothetical protein LshimejAT787_0600380 [Lyophyllum shimeji]